MTDVNVRLAGMGDAERVWSFASQFPSDMVHDRDAFMKMYPRMVSREDRYIALADIDGTPCGYIVASAAETFFANAPIVWVSEMLVAPDERSHGVGTAMMNAVEEWARTLAAVYVSAVADQASGFYAALGYAETGTNFVKLL